MSQAAAIEATQYLTFKLSEELFALDISKVREVLDFTEVTKVPRTPDFVKGVINLRGNVVPVVDMRLKFGMPPTERTLNTCIIIMEAIVDGQANLLGALADSVQEVIFLEQEQVEPAPRMGDRLNADFITGMGRRDNSFMIILDIDKVFSSQDIEKAAEVQDAEAL